MATKKKKTGKKKMEPSRAPDRNEGADKPAEKVFDVAVPGKGNLPSSTSRPMIVSHRSMAHDPMMVGSSKGENAAGSESESAITPSTKSSKSRIEPLSHDGDEGKDKADTPPVDEATDKSDKTTNDEQAEVDPPKKTQESPTSTDSADDEDLDEMNDYASQVAAKQAQKTEEDEQTKRLKAAEKLIENKQYFVPINSASRQRTKRVAVVFLVLVVVSVGAGVYLLFG